MMSNNKKDPSSTNNTGENVVGTIIAGGHAQVAITQNSVQKTNVANLERLFELLEEKIESRSDDPNVDKQEIRDQVNQIKVETMQGEKANLNKLERWIQNLFRMAPDIVDVIVASLAGPVSGVAAVIQKIAVRVKAESENKG